MKAGEYSDSNKSSCYPEIMDIIVNIALGIVMIAAMLLGVAALKSLWYVTKRGPKGIVLYQHQKEHRCPTPTMCSDSNECVMLCHEKNTRV